jgi:hypothetical protein
MISVEVRRMISTTSNLKWFLIPRSILTGSSAKIYQDKFIMNSTLNAMSANQVDNNDLRELSQGEKIEANGGKACYRNPVGQANTFRWISQGVGAQLQKWNGRNYVNQRYVSRNGKTFSAFCKNGGFNFFN